MRTSLTNGSFRIKHTALEMHMDPFVVLARNGVVKSLRRARLCRGPRRSGRVTEVGQRRNSVANIAYRPMKRCPKLTQPLHITQHHFYFKYNKANVEFFVVKLKH